MRKINRIYILALVLLAVLVASCGSSRKTAGESAPRLSYNDSRRLSYFLTEAASLESMGDYAGAFDLYEHCLEIDPSSAVACMGVAQGYAAMEQDSVALIYVEKASRLQPDNTYYMEALASLCMGMNQTDKALPVYERLSEASPGRTDVLLRLLSLYTDGKDWEKALSTITRMEQVEGTNERLALGKMQIYSLLGQKEESLGVLKNLSAEHPADPHYRVMIGNWLLNEKRVKEALQEFEGVLALDSTNQDAQMSMLDYYRAVGRDTLAFRIQESMLVNPDVSSRTKVALLANVVNDTLYYKGDSLLVADLLERMLAVPQKDAEIAEIYCGYAEEVMKMPEDSLIRLWQKVVDIDPEKDQYRGRIAFSYWKNNNYEGMRDACMAGAAYRPKKLIYYYLGALAHLGLDDRSKALKTLEKGIQTADLDEDNNIASDACELAGEMLWTEGRRKEAFGMFELSLKHSPENLSTLNNYAYYLCEYPGEDAESDYRRAEEMSAVTIKAEPGNATYLDTYAWCLYRLRRYAEAKIYIDEALRYADKEQDNTEIIEHQKLINRMNNRKK